MVTYTWTNLRGLDLYWYSDILRLIENAFLDGVYTTTNTVFMYGDHRDSRVKVFTLL